MSERSEDVALACGWLAGEVAHELAAPLNAIALLLATLERGEEPDRELLEIVAEECARLRGLLPDLRKLCRVLPLGDRSLTTVSALIEAVRRAPESARLAFRVTPASPSLPGRQVRLPTRFARCGLAPLIAAFARHKRCRAFTIVLATAEPGIELRVQAVGAPERDRTGPEVASPSEGQASPLGQAPWAAEPENLSALLAAAWARTAGVAIRWDREALSITLPRYDPADLTPPM